MPLSEASHDSDRSIVRAQARKGREQAQENASACGPEVGLQRKQRRSVAHSCVSDLEAVCAGVANRANGG